MDHRFAELLNRCAALLRAGQQPWMAGRFATGMVLHPIHHALHISGANTTAEKGNSAALRHDNSTPSLPDDRFVR